jgi:hypothetical protein
MGGFFRKAPPFPCSEAFDLPVGLARRVGRCEWLHPTGYRWKAVHIEEPFAFPADAVVLSRAAVAHPQPGSRTLFKHRLGTGFSYTAVWEFPQFVVTKSAAEGNFTGLREATVMARLTTEGLLTITETGVEGWVKDGVFLSDDPQWDAFFPDHPLTQVRQGVEWEERGFALRTERAEYHRTVKASAAAKKELLRGLEGLVKGRNPVPHLLRAQELYPDDDQVVRMLASMAVDAGRYEEGVRMLERVALAGRGYSDWELSMGMGLLGLGRGAEAVPHLERAAQLLPDYAPVQEGLTRARATSTAGP